MKKRMKSLVSGCLASLVFLMSAFTAIPAYAAGENGIAVSSGSVKNGDTFTVTLTVPANAQKADTVSIRAEFDNTAFELIEWTPAIPGATFSDVNNKNNDFFSVSSASAVPNVDLSAGFTLTASFKVKDSAAAGSYPFTLTRNNVTYYDETGKTNVSLWNPDQKNVAVTVEAGSSVEAECVHTLVKTAAKAATCEAKGNNEYYTCSKCNKVFKDAAGKTPTTVAAETLDILLHTGGTADCLKKAVCNRCGKSYGNLGGHVYGNSIAETKATCQKEGMKEHYICATCGKYFTAGKKETTAAALTIAKVSHHFVWVIDKSATATQTGIRHEECTYCSLKRNENTVIESHQHTFGADWKFNDVNHWHDCSCGEKSAVSPHVSDEGRTIVAPTSASSGTYAYFCSICGYEIRRITIPPTGTNNQNPGNTNNSGNTNRPNANREQISTPKEPDEIEEEDPEDTSPDDPDDSDAEEDDDSSDKEDDFWDRVIRTINSCEDGKTVSVDMRNRDDAIVPEKVFAALDGKDVGLRLKMGNGFSWKFHGSTIEEPQELDMSVELTRDSVDEELTKKLKDRLGSIQVSIGHEGDFGLTATLEIQFGEKFNGKYANLFYYDEENDCLSFTDSDQIDDGKAKLKLTHASEWFVTLTDTAYSGAAQISVNEPSSPNGADENPPIISNRGDYSSGEANPNTGLGVILIIPAAAGISVALAKKPKRKRGRR